MSGLTNQTLLVSVLGPFLAIADMTASTVVWCLVDNSGCVLARKRWKPSVWPDKPDGCGVTWGSLLAIAGMTARNSCYLRVDRHYDGSMGRQLSGSRLRVFLKQAIDQAQQLHHALL